ncbi:hypothetical protein [Dyadobacter psychrotolerans]|uniref:Uncharacterized protein n=1 Tax=Dyadobacter psychrotolerans TaxID=2541721 RepID=A0A4V2Z399_9BACT|nr:hypothetical protein [Dyadobacter psychrotolerans]TDE11938.1 hypothetical protein E0F88_23055 [Dyadobacter psychrotolerans]
MNDLLLAYNQLDEIQRRQLIAYADTLLAQQKAKQSEGNLAVWKDKIKSVSIWSDNEIKIIEESSKKLNQWEIPEW